MIIGTAGHVDHGKTTLVKALTGVDTDRLQEEKARGISIDLGFAYRDAPDGSVLGFVDVPGHERFLHNMLAGATGIDLVLLVVAADDGVMPQTIEHLAIVDLLGIEKCVVAITKADSVDSARILAVEQEVCELLAGTALHDAEMVAVSTIAGTGVDVLGEKLLARVRTQPRHNTDGQFRLAVDRSFTLTGVGTIVTGTVLSGSIEVGARVVISPEGRDARVRGIHAQNRPAQRGVAGERCALNLVGVDKSAVRRGDMVVDPLLHAPTSRIDARLRILASEKKPLRQWSRVRLHHAATEVGARVHLLEQHPIPPGGEAFVQLVLERPIAAGYGDRFVIRDTGARRTIGGGCFVDMRAPARRRRTPERLAQITAHAIPDPETALDALLQRPPYYVDLAAFARDRLLARKDMDAFAQRLGIERIDSQGGLLALSRSTFQAIVDSIVKSLAEFHAEHPDLAGVSFAQLRLRTQPRLPADILASLLRRLALDGSVSIDGAQAKLPGRGLSLSPADQDAWMRIGALLAGSERFRPPRVRDIADAIDLTEAHVRRLLKLMSRRGEVVEVSQDHFFLRTSLAEIVAIIEDIVAKNARAELTVAQLRDRLDNGRKVAMQLLEFFDRHGLTFRRGDVRLIDIKRTGLFGPVACICG